MMTVMGMSTQSCNKSATVEDVTYAKHLLTLMDGSR